MFLKIRDVKSPSRAYEYDAGIDFYVPKFTKEFIKDITEKNLNVFNSNESVISLDEETHSKYFILKPGMGVNIPSGIKCRMSKPGRALIAFNKSGISTKYGLVAGACVVDYLYQGEIHLNLINTSTKDVKIYEDMKILQFLEIPIFNSNIYIKNKETEEDVKNFYEGMSTDRGEKGFGSSQHK